MLKYLSLAVLAAFFISCSTTKKTSTTHDLEGMQHVTLDTMSVMANEDSEKDTIYPYRPERERLWDLQHVALHVSFDWHDQRVDGSATLQLTPYFYSQQTLTLDAVNFNVAEVIVDGDTLSKYTNTGTSLVIPLSHVYKQGDLLTATIVYSAHPTSGDLEGASAITDDKGLFFIDPLDTLPEVPTQIWTQGETSSNRRWYPTLDQPNERMTQEMWITVPDTFMTLSNGLLVESTTQPGNMRTDYWKMDLPHAPYLTMLAVGQWDKVTDYWRGRPVEYYVDRGYGADARAIFDHTPEMIEFYSTVLDFPFVWPKYSQVIVKDYVSGAMENTTAVVFGDFIQMHADEMLTPGANDYIVCHELFHHWFGDLVTCESWANLTLNEGFANYAEYLWAEHKYGREKADIDRMNELSGYFDQTKHTAHPLIWTHYPDEGAIFDAHSYNKGGLVLHMLRSLVGDKAFYASLHHYLEQHQFSSVEVDDLRQAFEEVTGQDLHWFFDQWYAGTGHPILDVQQTYDQAARKLRITIDQTQEDSGYTAVFRLPLDVDVYGRDTVAVRHQLILDKKHQEFELPAPTKPLAVILDPMDIQLAVMHQDIDTSEYAIRALKARSINHRISAIRLMTDMDAKLQQKLVVDTSWMVRAMMVSYYKDHINISSLVQMGKREKNTEIQYYILESLSTLQAPEAAEVAIPILRSTKSVPLMYMSLKSLEAYDVPQAMEELSKLDNVSSPAIYAVRASILEKGDKGLTLDYFKTPEAAQMKIDYLEELISAMANFLSDQPKAVQDEGLALIDSDFYLKGGSDQYRRFYVISGLVMSYNQQTDPVYEGRLKQVIRSLYQKEEDLYLRGILEDALEPLLNK